MISLRLRNLHLHAFCCSSNSQVQPFVAPPSHYVWSHYEIKMDSKQSLLDITFLMVLRMITCFVGRFDKLAGMAGGGRIQLKTWQQAAVALGSAVGALLDPRRADLIAALGETTGKPAFERVLQRMKSCPEGRVSINTFFCPYSPFLVIFIFHLLIEMFSLLIVF